MTNLKDTLKNYIVEEMQQTGITTHQMKWAPLNSIYIWVNSDLSYPKRLAEHLSRNDLEIVRPSWLEHQKWRGREITAITIDHAAQLTKEQKESLEYARSKIR